MDVEQNVPISKGYDTVHLSNGRKITVYHAWQAKRIGISKKGVSIHYNSYKGTKLSDIPNDRPLETDTECATHHMFLPHAVNSVESNPDPDYMEAIEMFSLQLTGKTTSENLEYVIQREAQDVIKRLRDAGYEVEVQERDSDD